VTPVKSAVEDKSPLVAHVVQYQLH
jgi:hypothetical protein